MSRGGGELIQPRISHVPPGKDRHEYAKRGIDLCGRNGLVLDDWQQLVLEASLLQNGERWAASTLGVHMPRQNGKTALVLARLLTNAYIVKAPLSLYSAHLYDTSMEIFRRAQQMIEDSPELRKELAVHKRTGRAIGFKMTHGAEGFELKGDVRIRFRTRSKGGGRGFTGHLIVFDEAMVLPEHVEAAMKFTLSGDSTAGNPQIWLTGSAVDQESHEYGVVFARARERGMRGDDPTLAWFDWSVEGDNPDFVPSNVLSDPAAWAQANPALGKRIALEWVEEELRGTSPRDFAVERLGIGDWPRTDHIAANPINYQTWVALADEGGVIQQPDVVAFDVSPERKSAIAICGLRKDGRHQVEITESRSGTAWVAPEVARLVKKYRLKAFCDGRGPAASLAPELRDLGVEVELLSATEHGQACGQLMDAVERGSFRHLDDPELNGAVRAAVTRPLGDAWAWSRKDSATNIAPLVAATLALSAATTSERPRKVAVAWG